MTAAMRTMRYPRAALGPTLVPTLGHAVARVAATMPPPGGTRVVQGQYEGWYEGGFVLSTRGTRVVSRKKEYGV